MRLADRPFRLTAALACALILQACGHPLWPEASTRPFGGAMALESGVTPEEAGLMAESLLPAAYPALKAALAKGGLDAARALYRQGKRGPFAEEFGDPTAMLAAARYAHTHADFARLLHSLKRGDLMFISQNDPQNFVARATGGPFDHVMLCTDPAPPGQFLEAAGVTDKPGDQTGSRVRWDGAAGCAQDGPSERLLRPAGLLPAGQQAAAVDTAIAFAQAQLGKPYNYSFSDKTAGDRAFYCSSLVYEAYAKAGVPWAMHKTPADDRLVLAFQKLVLGLQPDDPLALSYQSMTFMQQSPRPDSAQMAHFIVYNLLPHCKTTANIALDDQAKAELAAALARVLAGNAFPHFSAEADKYLRTEAASREATSRLAASLALDGRAIAGDQDINTWQALKAFTIVLSALLPYADDTTAYLTGPGSSATRLVSHLLDLLDALHALGIHWPIPGFGLADLPGRAPWGIDPDFESPSDLAWAREPHWDFDVPPGATEDPPWPFAVIPPNGRFTLLAAR